MLGTIVAKTIITTVGIATLPARATIYTGVQAAATLSKYAEEWQHLQHDLDVAKEEANRQIDQFLTATGNDFARAPEDMSPEEREAVAITEWAKAEQFLAQGIVSLFKVARLALAEPSRVIEHKPYN